MQTEWLRIPRQRFTQRTGSGAFALALLSSLLLCSCGENPRAVPSEADKSLAAEAEDILSRVGFLPIREYANFLRTPGRLRHRNQLAGKIPATDQELRKASADIARRVQYIKSHLDWPRPQAIQIPRTDTRPVIDGSLDDKAWKQAAVFTSIYPFNSKTAGGPDTTWRMAWDAKYLYFAFKCEDENILAPEFERDEDIWEHDCVEAFIRPDYSIDMYWEIVISPTGAIYDSLNAKHWAEWGSNMRPEENIADLRVGTHANGTVNREGDTDAGYTVEMAVPFNQLPGFARREPRAGDQLQLILVRLDRSDDKTLKPYAIAPLLSWGHNIWNHIPIELVAATADPSQP